MTHGDEVGAMVTLCRALDGGDVGPLAARLDAKSRLRLPGLSGLGGDYQGCEAIVGVLRRMVAATGGTLRLEVHDSTARGGVMRIEGLLSGTRNRHPSRAPVLLDARLDGDVFGSITIECADRSAWDALWA